MKTKLSFSVVVFTFLIFSMSFTPAHAKSFIIYNATQPSQTHFIMNGTTGYTGIGTDNPSYPLDIVGDVRWSGNLTGGNVSWVRLRSFPAGCPVGQAVRAINETDFTCVALNSTSGNMSGSGTANYISKFITEDTLGNSIIYDGGTTVGIGLGVGIAAAKTLDVVGDINATNYVYGMNGLCIGTDCKTAWSQVTGTLSPWDNSTTQTFIRAGYPLIINISNTLFVNGSSGKVGVGTGAGIPVKTFDVVGDINATVGIYGASIFQNGKAVLDNTTAFGGNVSGTYNSIQLAPGSVNSSAIVDGSIAAADIAATITLASGQTINTGLGTINASHLNGQTSSYYLNTSTTFGGNVTGNWNTLQIASNSVDSAKIVDGSIAAADISDGTITAVKLASDLGLGWNNLTGYPDACPAGYAINTLADNGSLTCIATNATSGNMSGAGSQNYVAKFLTGTAITNSIIYDNGSYVGIGTASPNATIEVNGGMRLNTTTAKPACEAGQRGTFWLEQSGSGTDDYMYACMRNSTSGYNWVLVARAG